MPEETERVRRVAAAAHRLTDAIHAHLRAVEQRAGEQDPAVRQAYLALRQAAAAYDDLLFDVHGEVPPFVLAEPPRRDTFEVAPPAGDQPLRLSVLTRTDAVVEDAGRLLNRVRAEAAAIDAAEAVVDEVSAVGVLVELVGADAVEEIGEEYGLRGLGSTAWVLEAVPQRGDTWMDDAFAHAHPDLVRYRVDAPPRAD